VSGRRIRVGLIGTGRIAGFVHVPSLRLLPDLCEVTAVASRDPAKYDQGVAFVRAIRGETTDYPTFRDGAEVQRVVDTIDLSARERRWVEIAPD
jgi:predicted dehydrogenase